MLADFLAATLLAAGLPAAAPPIPDVPVAVQIIAEDGAYAMRTASDDKPLYTYDRDAQGKSACTDSCAAAWPPLPAPSGAKPVGKWTVVTRAEGASQWAFGGKPVYTSAHDAEGVPSGDGMGGVWHLLPAIPAK
jgi:predicted lipoprotein with Yx(FWY)xxD motif